MSARIGVLALTAGLLAAGCSVAQPAAPGDRGDEGPPRYGGVFRVHEPFDPYDWDITPS